MSRPTHPRVAAIAGLLAEAGIPGRVHELAEGAHTAAAAAAGLGVPVGAIANSLVFDVGGQPLLVLTSGAHRVDVGRVATLLGVPRVRRASADFVREHTGQPIGGVAPVGHPAPIGTLVDVELARYERVWAAAGHPSAVFPTTFDELLQLTGGTPAEVGDGPPTDGPTTDGPPPDSLATVTHPATVGP
ncbi:Cys-tRNA(Pro) deacylase, prolyl-tRNA editing enzyme YbaK/EbsC [Geodermatophilus amargosae]|uniref:Cys-tRNA(Pro) deacylase, prolyl-tRNA editing enzyme YbaK/EbsC n=1 Tax=Geodermatophilus amargosae TaxID=1296565 RepID=A0A1I7ARL3_9ACTN|nr:YbaK/EbsC family protein [Geodermatophilus amargosae]SFT77543.1 Cys-tRNA(Pro) deacylase, prolyl-tRNA editing enzyme YbaK/EbsC [Geodermatophilus amargosae]